MAVAICQSLCFFMVLRRPYRLFLPAVVVLVLAGGARSEPLDGYLDAPLEALLEMEVTSVNKKAQRLGEVAGAVYVITRKAILRSGVTSLAEALRLAPGIQVARIDANKWAISARGFNHQFADKLLVMIDGRTVYSPSFSGVYWDAQDVLLDDIERIEVIRGPGAAVWGANAVNGVINIITRSAVETEGTLATLGVGGEERFLGGLRHGRRLGDNVWGRAYVKHQRWDDSRDAIDGGAGGDRWWRSQGGFRLDGHPGADDRWTLQGDLYHAREHQRTNRWQDPGRPENAMRAPLYLETGVDDRVESEGWNLLGRWNHTTAGGGRIELQLYFDHTRREEFLLGQRHDIFDLDLQHQFSPWRGHDLIWGLGYRHIRDQFENSWVGAMQPERQGRDLYSAFIQDEITLSAGLRLILGAKFEHHDDLGLQTQPSARLLWRPDDRNTLWASVSRAVRAPSRLERSGRMVTFVAPAFPPFVPDARAFHALGNQDLGAETVIAWEFGYRLLAAENLSIDLALYDNAYSDLTYFQRLSGAPLSDVRYANGLKGHTRGMEITVVWSPLEWWRLEGWYSHIAADAWLGGSVVTTIGEALVEGSTPGNQFSLRSEMDLPHQLSLDLWIQHSGALRRSSASRPESAVPAWTSFNLRLGWRPRQDLELALVGTNLFDASHLEFVGENFLAPTEVERSFHIQLRKTF